MTPEERLKSETGVHRSEKYKAKLDKKMADYSVDREDAKICRALCTNDFKRGYFCWKDAHVGTEAANLVAFKTMLPSYELRSTATSPEK